jgi:hypothetical protein
MCATTNKGEEYCTCPNGYNLTMTDNVTGICESKYILIYNLTMTDNVTGICESKYILIYNLTQWLIMLLVSVKVSTILIYNLTMTDNVTGICESKYNFNISTFIDHAIVRSMFMLSFNIDIYW